MNKEPTVLDYVKALLTPWRGSPPEIPNWDSDHYIDTSPKTDINLGEQNVVTYPEFDSLIPESEKDNSVRFAWPWCSLLMLVLLLAAQRGLEPPDRTIKLSLVFYIISSVLFVWAIISKEWDLFPMRESRPVSIKIGVKWKYLAISLPFGLTAFLFFSGNRFNQLNLFLWVVSIIFFIYSFWESESKNLPWYRRLLTLFQKKNYIIKFSRWGILFTIITIIILFIRVYLINKIPNEMFSDHAEKLQDVQDILNGQYSIFFPRNTGREAIQMYLTAAIALIFGTGISFISLKIGSVLAGILALPYIYLTGKEIGNRWVGILAFGFAGIAYWPNVISRIGLRFPFYPLFVAPTLYYLIRGFRHSKRNDFLLAGLFLGLGLHGYSPFRIVPLLILIAFGLYFLHVRNKENCFQVIWMLSILVIMSIIIFLPLFRYYLEAPDMFSFRALTRLGTIERPLPEPMLQVLLKNYWNASIMYFWNDGNIWVNSIPGRPALDVVSAVFYFIGSLYVFTRYIRYRNWIDLFLLLSVPILMLPSILSLAFPDENPALNRLSGAIIPVFLIIAVGFEAIISMIRKISGRTLASLIAIILITWSFSQNYYLVFNQFNRQFTEGSWNTSDIGNVIRAFADSVGSQETAYVIPYPHWVDTRLVGVNSGFGVKDFALSTENIIDTLSEGRSKLFIINSKDIVSLTKLRSLYPFGIQWEYDASLEGKDFYVFFVPTHLTIIN
jgi:hypothetical protein